MQPTEVYTLKILGVDVRLAVLDSGLASDEVLGDAVYRFEGDLARLLAPMRLATYTADFSRSFERTLGDYAEDATGEAFDPEVDDVLALPVDAGIGAVALLLDRGEPFEVEVDLDTSTDGPFWAFHDLAHAVDDCGGDWDEGLADFPPPSAWAEDRANLEGARRALRAGVDFDTVLGVLARLRDAFRERFEGEESTALDNLLDGGLDFLPDDVRARIETPEQVEARVESTARDMLDYAPADADLDDLDDLAREYGEGVGHTCPGAVVAALRDFDDLADCYGPGEAGPDMSGRAAYAFGGALAVAVRRLAQCEECEVDRRRPGSTTCADCADE